MNHDIPLLSETKMSVDILTRVLENRDLLHLTQDECHLLYKQRAALKTTLHDAKSYTRLAARYEYQQSSLREVLTT